jgi:hypothetical protein
MIWLNPYVFVRLLAGAIAALLFAHAAFVGTRVVRYFHLASTTEGQLALERQAELAGTSARAGAILQAGALLLSITSADHLTTSIRGAMCGYGVVHANEYGPRSIVLTVIAALLSAAYFQALSLDRATRGLRLVKPLAYLSMLVALVSFADLSLASAWLGGLDMTVVSSCCSTGIDAAASALERGHAAGPRVLVTAAALVALPLTAGLAFFVSRRPSRVGSLLGGALAVVSLPIALAAVVLEVAPYVYEVPHHRCPYCLFHLDAWGIGYPLFGAIFLGATWGTGSLIAAYFSGDRDVSVAFAPFVRARLRREAIAFSVALALGVLPVVRYAIVAPGASLFP